MQFELTNTLKELLKELNLNVSFIQQKAKIPIQEDRFIQLTASQYISLMQVLDKYLNDQQIIKLSNVTNLQQFIPTFYASLASPDGITALHRFSRYKSLIGPVQVELTETNQLVKLSFIHQATTIPRLMLLNEQLSVVNLLRTGSGIKIKPQSISGPYTYGEIIADYLTIPGRKSETNQIVFTKEDLDIPFITENNIMWQYLAPSLDKELALKANNSQLQEQLQALLMKTLPGNQATLKEIAKMVNISERTLQRRLKEEGTSFKAILTQVQIQLAKTYLKQDLPTDEIAYLVGYTETSSFLRAFKKWTGQTVNQFKDGK